MSITVIDSLLPQDQTITVDPMGALSFVTANGTLGGTFTMENVQVSDDAANADWIGEIDPSTNTLVLTSTNGDTAEGETVTVTFTGAHGSPWWTGTANSVLYDDVLTATRQDTFDSNTTDIEFILPIGTLAVSDGTQVTTTSGETTSVITVTGSPVPKDLHAIDIDISGLCPMIASGGPCDFTDTNVVITDTSAFADWTGSVNPVTRTLELTSANGFTAVGEKINVKYTGAVNPWVANSGGRQTIDLPVTRIDMDTLPVTTAHLFIDTSPPPGVSTINTNIPGLTVTTVGGVQTVDADTGVLDAALIPNSSVLVIKPAAGSGIRTITIYALDGAGFASAGGHFTGNPTSVQLVSDQIAPPGGFAAGIGPLASFSYSIDLPRYPEGATLTTTIWQAGVEPSHTKILQVAAGNSPPAAVLNTAYTARVTKTNLPADASIAINASLLTDWEDDMGILGGHSGTTFLWRIADDGNSGEFLPTTFLFNDAGDNLDYFAAPSTHGLSTFGISSLSGNNNPFQLVSLAVAEHVQEQNNPDSSNPAPQNQRQNPPPQPPPQNPPPQPPPPQNLPEAKTVDLYLNDKGVVTQETVVEAPDNLATVTIGQGVTALDATGAPLSSVSIAAMAGNDMPAMPAGNTLSFAGRAYELGPNGATFSPGITVTFPAPDAKLGDEFTVQVFDHAAGTWQDVPTVYDPQAGTVTATVSHFCCIALFTKSSVAASSSHAPAAPKPAGTAAAPPAPSPKTPLETVFATGIYGLSLIVKNPLLIIAIAAAIVTIYLVGRRRRGTI